MPEITAYFLIMASFCYPSWFPPAPADQTLWGPAIEHRRLHETHICQACGAPSRCSYISQPPEWQPPQIHWMDLCPDDDRQFRIALGQLDEPHGKDMLEQASQLVNVIVKHVPEPVRLPEITTLISHLAVKLGH